MCQQTATIETIEANAHPFERAGLGKAPFRCIGVFESVYQACPGAPIQPAGTCQYCGMGIRYCCRVQSADRKTFVVGCDCVMKLDRESNRELVAVVKTEKAKRESARRKELAAAKKKAEYAVIDAARESFKANRDQFTNRPHPNEYYAGKGLTLADYMDWTFLRGSHSGRLAVAKIVAQG